ncbi:MAG: hypothetical protein WC781_02830 [Candidatus Pacearchaeota archaeon]|jgi:hypothetical protein
MNYKRLKKISDYLEDIPEHKWCANKDKYELLNNSLIFRLYLRQQKGRIVNGAEGGLLIGEGENSEVLHSLPIKVDTQKVTLDVMDSETNCVIESYEQYGDDISINYFDIEKGKNEENSLFFLYRKIQKGFYNSESEKKVKQREINICKGREKLDKLLEI